MRHSATSKHFRVGDCGVEEFMRHCISALCFCCLSLFVSGKLIAAPASGPGKGKSDWPCQQILVGHLSPAAVWSGPSVEGINWMEDPDIAELATKLAARRVPLDEAKGDIDKLVKTAGAEKQTKLTMLFAALFEKLDGDRAQVIAGLERFGHAQKAMADRIRAENEKLQATQNASPPEMPGQEGGSISVPNAQPNLQGGSGATAGTPTAAPGAAATPLERLQWDLRIFEDRRHSLTYACEVPVLIEQRLFALGREIQNHLD
jgi:hypothetical protein